MNELVSFDLFESLELAALPGFGVTALLALRLLAAWYYLGERLTQETLYFEESGWYDGFLQTKPAQTLYRDRLAYQDQVRSQAPSRSGPPCAALARRTAARRSGRRGYAASRSD